MNTNDDRFIDLLEKFAACFANIDKQLERLDIIIKQLDRIENTRPFFLPVPPSSIPPGTHTPPLLGPGYTAPFIGDEITICKHPDGGV